MERVTAVFDNRDHAEQAVNDLRSMGVADAHLSFVSKHEGDERGGSDAGDDAAGTAAGAGKGLAAGAGVGALFGIGAALIPGVGPFITAGWLASALGSAVAGGAAAGALVGGTAGAVSGALANAGYTKEEADYYGGAVERGDVMVAVDTRSGYAADQVRDILTRHGGKTYQ